MRAAAARNADRPLLKLKLGGPGDLDRVAAVRKGAPNARIIVDANEGWTAEDYRRLAPELARLAVAMIEQPLRVGDDDALAGRYDVINIKLDKAGGLTEALALREEARARGFDIMVGCMIATSLSMAPALLVADGAACVDLDGPLWLAKDRTQGLHCKRWSGRSPYPLNAHRVRFLLGAS